MNLKELRMWHHKQMNEQCVLAVYAHDPHHQMSNFHLSAIQAITDVIGGSVEQDKKDALEMAALINPTLAPILNKDFSVSVHDHVRKGLYGNPKAQTVPEKIRSLRTINVYKNPVNLDLIDPDATGGAE